MRNEEAILILEQYMPKPSRGNGKSIQTLKLTEAFLLAIRALDEQINTERQKGKWITDSNYPDTVICNKCNSKYDVWWIDKGSNYCPNCGAEMEGVAKIATTTEEVE